MAEDTAQQSPLKNLVSGGGCGCGCIGAMVGATGVIGLVGIPLAFYDPASTGTMAALGGTGVAVGLMVALVGIGMYIGSFFLQ